MYSEKSTRDTLMETKIRNLVKEEVEHQLLLRESFSPKENKEIRQIIRDEISDLFYDLFRKRSFWVNL